MQLYELEKRITMDVKHLAKLHNICMDGIMDEKDAEYIPWEEMTHNLNFFEEVLS